MSWPMLPMQTGQWTPGVPQMMPDMNVGSYTPDQWAAMQQQNWQQWAQWQQQYAQWQNQYGEKYAEQMQTMQTMGGMPPLPPSSGAPPPAPPPPDHPPPPPAPHENNQPLYGNTQPPTKPGPVPAPLHKPSNTSTGNYNNMNITTGSNQTWPHNSDTYIDPAQSQQAQSVNSEALKKLAEEERLFDIQFQKWEEEIEKWKRENVNHPDKQAYSEYEQKFEACRAQLMERRQQMKQKRARLTGAPPPQTNAVPVGNISTSAPPQLHNNNKIYNQNVQSQDYQNKSDQNNYKKQSNSQQYDQYNNTQQTSLSRSNNKNIDPQDRYESYQEMTDYSINTNNNSTDSNFLRTSATNKSIPGLDLVPDTNNGNKAYQQEVIDITDDQLELQRSKNSAPDYSKISKGINNILGDEKIMNILSMVRGQNAPKTDAISSNQALNITGPYPGNVNSYNDNNQWNQNDNNYNQGYDKQNPPFNRPGPNYSMQQRTDHNNFQGNQNFQNQFDNRQPNMSQENYYANTPAPIREQNMPPKPLMAMNIQPPRGPLLDAPVPNNDYARGPQNRDMYEQELEPPMNQPPKPKWVDEPLFTPSIIVEYEHKPLRLKARDFIEPVHTFDYDHKSKEGHSKKKDFDREVDELFTRKPRRSEDDFETNRYTRDLGDRRVPKDDLREDYSSRIPPRDEYEDRRRSDDRRRLEGRRFDDRYEDRRLAERRPEEDRYERRDDSYRDRERERERERERDRNRDQPRDRITDLRRDDNRNRSRSYDRDSRKRGRSRESEISNSSGTKKLKDNENHPASHSDKRVVMIDDILEPPGRDIRPSKIVIILRGLPGSGKSYLAKLIRDKEAEYGGTVRIMSIDDYFMQEGEVEEIDPNTGKKVKKPSLKYEYDENFEESYLTSLKKAVRRTITDGYFSFLIFDAVNDQLKSYADVWNFGRQNGFQVYVVTMEMDAMMCYKRNIHNRTLDDIEVIKARFFPTPAHHIQLDPTTLLQNAAITEVQMEDVSDYVSMEDTQEPEVEISFTSKWEKMDDANQLARLDGISKPLRPSQYSMEDYLQIDDWKPNTAKPGKKTVRWADIEERRSQEKMRAIGFVVGQTDWNRMTDPTMGSSALTQTKYIERVRRN